MAEHLVQSAARGDPAAWNELVERYVDLVWSIARSHSLTECDAADVTQTTWLRLAEQLTHLHEPGRVGAWLATTARRESLRVIRDARRSLPSGAVPELEVAGHGQFPESRSADGPLLASERDAELWRAFRQLTPACQRLLRTLMADPAPSYAEVSVSMEMPIGSIGPTRARCLDRLRANLVALGPGGPLGPQVPSRDGRDESTREVS